MMSELSPETRKLLGHARDGDVLSAGRRAQMKTQLFASVIGGAALGTKSAAGRALWASAQASPVMKGLAGFVLLSSVGMGTYVGLRAARSDEASRNAPSLSRAAGATMVPGVAPTAPVAAPMGG